MVEQGIRETLIKMINFNERIKTNQTFITIGDFESKFAEEFSGEERNSAYKEMKKLESEGYLVEQGFPMHGFLLSGKSI